MAKLDLDDEGRVFEKDDETPYREQLRALAGVESDDGPSVSKQRTDEYVDRWSRSELSDIIKVVRSDRDEINLNAAGLTDMAEYLTQFTAATVEDAADAALGDADPDAVTIELAAESRTDDEASNSEDEADDSDGD
jgi:hypothetical protein